MCLQIIGEHLHSMAWIDMPYFSCILLILWHYNKRGTCCIQQIGSLSWPSPVFPSRSTTLDFEFCSSSVTRQTITLDKASLSIWLQVENKYMCINIFPVGSSFSLTAAFVWTQRSTLTLKATWEHASCNHNAYTYNLNNNAWLWAECELWIFKAE